MAMNKLTGGSMGRMRPPTRPAPAMTGNVRPPAMSKPPVMGKAPAMGKLPTMGKAPVMGLKPGKAAPPAAGGMRSAAANFGNVHSGTSSTAPHSNKGTPNSALVLKMRKKDTATLGNS